MGASSLSSRVAKFGGTPGACYSASKTEAPHRGSSQRGSVQPRTAAGGGVGTHTQERGGGERNPAPPGRICPEFRTARRRCNPRHSGHDFFMRSPARLKSQARWTATRPGSKLPKNSGEEMNDQDTQETQDVSQETPETQAAPE